MILYHKQEAIIKNCYVLYYLFYFHYKANSFFYDKNAKKNIRVVQSITQKMYDVIPKWCSKISFTNIYCLHSLIL